MSEHPHWKASCLVLVVAAFSAVALASNVADAAIEAVDGNATLQMPAGGAATVVSSGDFSAIAWVRPSSLPDPAHTGRGDSGQANIVHLDGGPSLRLLSDGSIRASMHGTLDGSSYELIAVTNAVLPEGNPEQWMLVGISFDSAAGALDVWARSETTSFVNATALEPRFVAAPVGDTIFIGSAGDVQAMVGLYGLIALRDHAVTETDMIDLWEHRRHHGPYSLKNAQESGGSMTGPDGCLWMINHAMTTRPVDAGAGGNPPDRAAIVDEPVTIHNMHIYDVTQPDGSSLRAVRPVNTTTGFIHRSPYEPPPIEPASPDERFFVRTLPEVPGSFPSPPHYVARVSPNARLLATELPAGVGLIRVLASGNSRALQAGDGSADGTGNFAHGFLWNNLERTAGVLNRPARLDAGPWFGFDCAEHDPYSSGDVTNLRFTDFSRFWTSQSHTQSPGPGQGLQLKSGASFAMRCRPQGMIKVEQPLMIQAHLLRFPGASDVQWVPNKNSRQGEAGTDVGQITTVSLDTETWSRVFDETAGDQVVNATRIALVGNHVGMIGVGYACHVGGGSLSVVHAVAFDGERTNVDFEHPFSVAPGDGSLLRFGPWEFTTVWHRWPSFPADNSNRWRGMKLTAGPGEGVVLFSFDAWRPGVDGFVFGVAGWGGMGYEQHIKRSFSGVTSAWAARLNPDVWLQTFATQLTNVTWMATYTNAIRAALPDAEVLWLGDVEHPSNWDDPIWHIWSLDLAQQHDVLASSVFLHPDLGGQLDLFGDGLRSDVLHLSQRGNQRLAQLWTEDLLEAAMPGDLPKLGDLTGDGFVNVSDLLALLGAWGPCENVNACPADLDGDGVVNVADLLILLSNWG